jgi:hypothetical protein
MGMEFFFSDLSTQSIFVLHTLHVKRILVESPFQRTGTLVFRKYDTRRVRRETGVPLNWTIGNRIRSRDSSLL